MNSQRTRKSVAELAIGLMVCGAVHMFLIAPQNEKLAKVQAEADSIGGTPAATTALSADQLGALTLDAAAKAEEVARLSEAAQDETRLFSAIMTLAEKSGVRIDQLQPTGEPAGAAKPAAAVAPTAAPDPANPPVPPPPPTHGAVGYSMVISTSYSQLVGFLAALPREIGFTVIRSVRTEPGDASDGNDENGVGRVRAHVQTEHYWFDASRLKQFATAGAEGASGGGAPTIAGSK